MIVNSVNNISYPYNAPSFKYFCVKQCTPEYSFLTKTEFFRQDVCWNRFIDLLNMKYKNADKVNIICHACSDGEEAYSLALKLITDFGEKAEKFFPIIARDINHDNICLAKAGEFAVSDIELDRIDTYSEGNFSKFFNSIGHYIKAKDILKDKIIFEQGDILTDVEQFGAENTVIMCRNILPNMPPAMRKELAEKLSKYIAPSSLVVFGEWDICDKLVYKYMAENGFIMSNLRGIYYKSENKYKPANLMHEMYLYLSKKN